MTYSVEITGSWWRGYWVVIFADGREAGRSGPYRRRHAKENAALIRAAYGVAS